MNMQDMEGYKELMDKMLDTLPADQVLSHYAPSSASRASTAITRRWTLEHAGAPAWVRHRAIPPSTATGDRRA